MMMIMMVVMMMVVMMVMMMMKAEMMMSFLFVVFTQDVERRKNMIDNISKSIIGPLWPIRQNDSHQIKEEMMKNDHSINSE